MNAGGGLDLHAHDVFRSLSEVDRAFVDSMTQGTIGLAANRPVVSEGEVGIPFLLITSGWAFRHKRAGNGSRQILDFLLPGEIIGLQAAVLGMTDHSVHSLTPISLQLLDARLVGEAFRRFPALAMRLTRHFVLEAKRTDDLLTVIGCCNAIQRLAFLVINLCQRLSRRGPVDLGHVPFPLRRQHVADALGLTGAHVNRTLNKLQRDGVIAFKDQHLVISNMNALSELAACGLQMAAPSAPASQFD